MWHRRKDENLKTVTLSSIHVVSVIFFWFRFFSDINFILKLEFDSDPGGLVVQGLVVHHG